MRKRIREVASSLLPIKKSHMQPVAIVSSVWWLAGAIKTFNPLPPLLLSDFTGNWLLCINESVQVHCEQILVFFDVLVGCTMTNYSSDNS